LWESWKHDNQTVESCSILTTEPKDVTRPIHDSKPVIVGPAHYADWLDATASGTAATCGFLSPYPAGEMVAVPVSTHVNNPRNNDPACVMPLASEK
jgi:putative SOS response-associated peptidase YedK